MESRVDLCVLKNDFWHDVSLSVINNILQVNYLDNNGSGVLGIDDSLLQHCLVFKDDAL